METEPPGCMLSLCLLVSYIILCYGLCARPSTQMSSCREGNTHNFDKTMTKSHDEKCLSSFHNPQGPRVVLRCV